MKCKISQNFNKNTLHILVIIEFSYYSVNFIVSYNNIITN